MTRIPVAVQLYTLRQETENDFHGTLQEVAKLGFDGVEFAGFGGHTAEEVKGWISELGLEPASAHIPLDRLQNDLDQVLEEARIVGYSYIVCPYIEDRNEEDYEKLIASLKEIGERCSREGVTLCYHNHDFELENLSDGRTALETIFESTNPDHVQTELDVYWLKKAGEDPVQWLEKYKGRAPLVHLKDMTLDDEQFFAELGTGGVDVDGILAIGEDVGVRWWVVEQDDTRKTPLESLRISMDYVNRVWSEGRV